MSSDKTLRRVHNEVILIRRWQPRSENSGRRLCKPVILVPTHRPFCRANKAVKQKCYMRDYITACVLLQGLLKCALENREPVLRQLRICT